MALQAGQTTLGAIRAAAQARADMVFSGFLSTAEWNANINSSYQELFDLLVQKYWNEYYIATRYTFVTDGINDHFALPDGSSSYLIAGVAAPAFYKLLGVDLQLATGQPATNITLKPFAFSERNRWTLATSAVKFGNSNLRYRLAGSISGNAPTQQLWLIPSPPASGQTIGVYYVPRLSPLALDADVVDGVSGWEELIVIDAAIKALQKEESDVSALMAQKEAMGRRIESAAENRDAGMPATVADVRSRGRGGAAGNEDGEDGYL